jgi:galactokinase/mevalonate kinase-like predicted kinase
MIITRTPFRIIFAGVGFRLFYRPKQKQPQVKEALGSPELGFSFEPEGSKIIIGVCHVNCSRLHQRFNSVP